MERLQKLLARAGVASRRAAENLILDGRVAVDGQVVTELGARADPASSEIAVDGRPIVLASTAIVLMLNKPAGMLSTRIDDRGRPTVMDLVPSHARSLVYPVGRLDLDSTGLLLLTNDGALAFRLTHPSFHVPKRYDIITWRPVSAAQAQELSAGIMLEDGLTAPADVATDPRDPRHLTMTLYEGRKRQIRLMLRALDHRVSSLHRIAMGPLELGSLEPGHVRPLTPAEIARLREAVGLPGSPNQPEASA